MAATLEESLDVSVLDNLFEDDWHNLYEPINITDTKFNSLNNTDSATFDEILQRLDAAENTVKNFEDSANLESIMKMQTEIQDISTKVSLMENNLEDVDDFLVDILHWEKQSN